jgi:putative ATP-dependent endonuclease of OLD family
MHPRFGHTNVPKTHIRAPKTLWRLRGLECMFWRTKGGSRHGGHLWPQTARTSILAEGHIVKISSVRIENFRIFRDETVHLGDYTCFVGVNGCGKSTVLNALNVFFRQYKDSKTDLSRLSIEDFHHRNPEKPVTITVTFTDLTDEAKADLSDYVRQGELTVSSIAHFDHETNSAPVKQYGSRLGMEAFRRFFEEDKAGARVAELKDTYHELKQAHSDLARATTKAAMVDALHEYETNHRDECVLIQSEDQFYGVSKGANRLERHLQWVFIPASKDATEESEESKNSALGQLLARTVRSKVNFADKVGKLKQETQKAYQGILDKEQSVLDSISSSLQDSLESWAHPGITAKVLWKQDAEKSVKVEEPWAFLRLGERGFEGELARFGHGLQRSFMLALLQELTQVADETAPTLIMGIEEPEIYQHPPQARHLAETLHELSEVDSQILICSHSPLFVPGDNFEAIRVVREKGEPSRSFIAQLSYTDLAKKLESSGQKALKEEGMLAKLYPSLNPVVSEMFFCNKLILTEGAEDVAYIATYLMLTGRNNEFRKAGCHIVPVGGKSRIIKPLAMAILLEIPVFVVCDADTDKDQIQDEAKRKSEVGKHRKDNRAILNLLDYEALDEWPSESITGKKIRMWSTNLTLTVDDELGDVWKSQCSEAYQHYGNASGLKKNPLAIARALKTAWEADVRSEALQTLVEDVVRFAQNETV